MAQPDPFVAADARAAGLARPGWIVTFERTADRRPGMVLVPAESREEAIANAAALACTAGIVQAAGELGTWETECGDCPLGVLLDLTAAVMQANGARVAISEPHELAYTQAVIDATGAPPAPSAGRVH